MSKPRLRGLDSRERAALVISECQSAIVDPELALFPGLGQQVAARQTLSHIAAMADMCRSRDIPVIHCVVRLLPEARGFAVASPLHAIMRKSPLLYTDRPESDVHPTLRPDPRDLVCERHHGITAFHGTDLEPMLRGLGVETIILAGVSTNIALIGTSIEAVNRGFAVVIPEDCTAGGTPETHSHSILNTLPILANVTQSEEIFTLWRQSA